MTATPSLPTLPPRPRLAFLHTSPVHVETFENLLRIHLPQARGFHTVDVSLLDEVRRDGPTSALRDRLTTHLDRIAQSSPDLIVCTCSSIGPLAELYQGPVATIRLDRPMAEAAIRIASNQSGRIGVAAALESTVQPTSVLLHDVATAKNVDVTLTPIPCFDAWAAFEAGDIDGYAARIAESVRPVAATCDVVILAQASMAVALPLLADLPMPLLTSPTTLIEAIVSAIAT